jgi:hypothetical protein
MKNVDSYELHIINESFDYRLYETKKSNFFLGVQNDLKKKLSLNLYFVGTFQMGISALYPIVEALMHNERVMGITDERIVLLTLFAITQILHVFNDDFKRIKEELKDQGLMEWANKVKETVLSVSRLFKFVAESFGKIVDAFTDMFAYVALAIPFEAVVLDLIMKHGLDTKTFPYEIGLIGVGVGIFSIKTLISKIWEKIKGKRNESYLIENNINDEHLLVSAFPGMRLISGFPGIGKSHFFRVMQQDGIKKVLDSDSTNFSWIEKGVRNPDFPNNYIDHIKKNKDKADIILISSHDVVRKALVENNIPFILVYPNRNIKEEYIARYRQRGSDEKFVKLLEDNWDKFIDDCEKQKGCKHVVIHSGEYLSNKIEDLMKDDEVNERLFGRKKEKHKVKTLKDWMFVKKGEPPMTFTEEENEKFQKEKRVIKKNYRKRLDRILLVCPYGEEKWENESVKSLLDPYGEEDWEENKNLYIIYVIGQDANFLAKKKIRKQGRWDDPYYEIAYKERHGRLVFDRGFNVNDPYPAKKVEEILNGTELVGYTTGFSNVRFDTLENIIQGTGINIDDINFMHR